MIKFKVYFPLLLGVLISFHSLSLSAEQDSLASYQQNGAGAIAEAIDEVFINYRRNYYQAPDLKFFLKLKDYYGSRQNLPIWVIGSVVDDNQTDFALTPHAEDFISLVKVVPSILERLSPSQKLLLSRLNWQVEKGGLTEAVEAELMLSDLFLYVALDLLRGGQSTKLSAYRKERPVVANLLNAIKKVRESDELTSALSGFIPDHWQYWKLLQARLKYQHIIKTGNWPKLPYGEDLEYGMESARIPLIRKYLILSGDLSPLAAASTEFDWVLEESVKIFQERHGLEVNLTIDRDFLRVANVSAADRLKQINLNIKRWQELPPQLENKYIMVNLPEFRLHAVEAGQKELDMNVVVGKTTHPTAIFSQNISYVVLNPYWNLPPSIITEDLIPLVKKEPSYLRKYDFEILTTKGWQTPADNFPAEKLKSYQIRQKPGKYNTLGNIKFMFPNNHFIYIHDTSDKEKHLFENAYRAESHGCVRVSKPLELAEFVLGDQGYHRDLIEIMIKQGSLKDIVLKKPLKVYLAYFTAFVNDDGQINFRQDLYGKDQILLHK